MADDQIVAGGLHEIDLYNGGSVILWLQKPTASLLSVMMLSIVIVLMSFVQIEDMYKSVHAAIRENPEAEAKPEKPEGQTKKKRYVMSIAVSFLYV